MNNLISQIKSKHNFNKNKSDKLLQEYEKFLVIRNGKNNFKPTDNVRLIWKQHILDTKHYADYCNKKFGKILHYNPNEDEESEEENDEEKSEDESEDESDEEGSEEENENNSDIQLIIKTLTGKSIYINCGTRDTAYSLKVKIQALEGIPPDQLRLIVKKKYSDIELRDDSLETLYDILPKILCKKAELIKTKWFNNERIMSDYYYQSQCNNTREEMRDKNSLDCYNIKNDPVIYLTLRGRGC